MRPTKRLKQKIEIGNLWLFILSSLSKGPMNGKDLKIRIMKKFDFITGKVTGYKVLYSLEASGYVKSEKLGKAVVYSITNRGRTELTKGKRLLRTYARRL